MKKVILAVAVLFSVAMVSCGGEKKAADSESIQVEESVNVEETIQEEAPVVDSPVADSNVEAAQ
ncbi:MAG: hypothetical protein K2N03_07600 [Muribaculaceae bacterium]|nr:hypothetical protein [Muribaculaceae bacterium]